MHLSPIQVPYLKAIYIWKCMSHPTPPPPPPTHPHSHPTPTIHPINLDDVSPPSMSQDSCLTSIQVLHQLHPGPKILLSQWSILWITSIKVPSHPNVGRNESFISIHAPSHLHLSPIDSHLASIQVVFHLNPGLYMCVPSPFRWRLSSDQVTKIASLFHPGNISNQSRS